MGEGRGHRAEAAASSGGGLSVGAPPDAAAEAGAPRAAGSGAADPRAAGPGTAAGDAGCCPHLHRAVELIGRRWTGAILEVLRQHDRPLRFSEIAAAVPGLSDRLCSERLKELEDRGLVERNVHPGPPVRVDYALTDMGRGLGPTLVELQAWARDWLGRTPPAP